MSNLLNKKLAGATLPALQQVFDNGSASDKASFQSSVSGAAITDAQARAGSPAGSAIGELRRISDGANAGIQVIWYQPAGASVPAWCWAVYPQSQYQG
jgi:hypothetical protein